jgi:hypothetical protein
MEFGLLMLYAFGESTYLKEDEMSNFLNNTISIFEDFRLWAWHWLKWL